MRNTGLEAGGGVTYLVGQLSAGGMERQLYYLLSGIDREQWNPTVVVWNPGPGDVYGADFRNMGVKVVHCPSRASSLARAAFVVRYVRQRRPEILHSYTFFLNPLAAASTVGIRTLAVGSIRANFVGEVHNSGAVVGRLSARWPRAQICNSETALHNVQQTNGPFRPRHLVLVRNAIDLSPFLDVPDALSTIPPVVGAVGSLVPRKRWDRVLAAAAVVRDRGLEFVLRIAGEGPLRRTLEAQARDLGLAPIVQFVGYVADIPRFMSQCSLLVHASENEGCPNAVVEAMASARPVVATTDAGDVETVLGHGEGGFVVDATDGVEPIASAIARLLCDEGLRLTMGRQARERARRLPRPDSLAAETVAAYDVLRSGVARLRSPSPPAGP